MKFWMVGIKPFLVPIPLTLPTATVTATAKHDEINELLQEHLAAEKLAGGDIHPAARTKNFTQVGREDDECKFTMT